MAQSIKGKPRTELLMARVGSSMQMGISTKATGKMVNHTDMAFMLTLKAQCIKDNGLMTCTTAKVLNLGMKGTLSMKVISKLERRQARANLSSMEISMKETF